MKKKKKDHMHVQARGDGRCDLKGWGGSQEVARPMATTFGFCSF
jgi:hypothetical protein